MNETKHDKLVRHLRRTPFDDLLEKVRINCISYVDTFDKSSSFLALLEKNGWTYEEFRKGKWDSFLAKHSRQ